MSLSLPGSLSSTSALILILEQYLREKISQRVCSVWVRVFLARADLHCMLAGDFPESANITLGLVLRNVTPLRDLAGPE